jgi:hypothetical protein
MWYAGALMLLCYRRVRQAFSFLYEGDTVDGDHLDWFALTVTLTIMSTVFARWFMLS